MLTTIGYALILLGGFVGCMALAEDNNSRKTPEEKLNDSIDRHTREVERLNYRMQEKIDRDYWRDLNE